MGAGSRPRRTASSARGQRLHHHPTLPHRGGGL